MDLDKVKELIKKGSRFASTDKACLELAERFGEFTDLYNRREEHLGDTEYLHKMRDAYVRFALLFKQISGNFGFSVDELVEHFRNPANFSQEEWEKMQDLKQRLGVGVLAASPNKDKTVKKPRNNRKKLRI